MLEWFGGNEDAEKLYQNLAYVAHALDDVVDNNYDKEQVINSFKLMLYDIPTNKVYQQYFSDLMPLVMAGIAGHEMATKFESEGSEHLLEIAHGLRYTIGNAVIVLCIRINGYQNTMDNAASIWSEIMNERWEEYKEEHKPKEEQL